MVLEFVDGVALSKIALEMANKGVFVIFLIL
jgi:hypothetical protein